MIFGCLEHPKKVNIIRGIINIYFIKIIILKNKAQKEYNREKICRNILNNGRTKLL